MKWFVRTALACALFTLSLFAADVSGTWKGTVESPNGAVERTFVFRTEGSKLTGETSSQLLGKSAIQNGTVEGDTLTFHIVVSYEGNDFRLNYKGKVEGGQIRFHVESDQGGLSLDFVAKKVS